MKVGCRFQKRVNQRMPQMRDPNDGNLSSKQSRSSQKIEVDLARRSKSGLARRPEIDSARESKQFRSSQKIEVDSARESKEIDSARESKRRRSSQKIEEDLARRSKSYPARGSKLISNQRTKLSIGSARGSKLQIKPEDRKKNKQHGVFPRFCGVLGAQIFGLSLVFNHSSPRLSDKLFAFILLGLADD